MKVRQSIEGQVLLSHVPPLVRLKFGDSFRYAGGQRFLFSGLAEAEQHFFVDTDDKGNLGRFYWIQFEHFLPGNNERYNYRPIRTLKLGGLTFIYDTELYSDFAGAESSPNSDGGWAKALLEKSGFILPQPAIRVRLIHLPGSDRRRELLIIYCEALARDKLPPIKNETPADEQFPELSRLVLQHAKDGLVIEQIK